MRVYTRAAAAAPPDMSRQLDYYRKQAAGLQRQAEQAEADGDMQLASDSRAAAAEETRQADGLSNAQDIRDAWDRQHEANRLAARAARQELDRRGITAEPDRNEPESLIEWCRQFEADAAAVDRAIEWQQQAAVDEGKAWPPQRGKIAEPAALEAQNAAEQPQQDGYQQELKLSENQQQTEMVRLAQPEREPEREAEPGYRADVGERIDASVKRVREAGERAAAELEAQRQEGAEYAARMAAEAQHEAEAARAWPSSQADDRSAEVDYEAEM